MTQAISVDPPLTPVPFVLRVTTERRQSPALIQTLSSPYELVVGRDASADLMLDDAMVSRRHVLIRAAGAGLEIEDVSSNGTLLDGAPLRQGRRQVGVECTLLAGTSKLTLRRLSRSVQVSSEPDTPTQPPPAPAVTPQRDESLNELRRSIHRSLLQELDLLSFDPQRREDPSLRPRVLVALRRIVAQLPAALPAGLSADVLVGEMADEALGFGPLEHLLADPLVTEIMLVDPTTIYVERAGKLSLSQCRFTDDERVRAVIERIVTPLGRRIDESSPLVDARLPDGSRVNIVIRPLALRGSCITIRKFGKSPFTFERMADTGSLSAPMARFLQRSVRAKKNIVIAGGTGSGKTTLLNALAGAIPEAERIVTIEDAAELRLPQPHVVSLEARPANMEGKGEVSIRDLVKNALRMRPDRIVVGECRGPEALDMLQAMNTGHAGSLTTTHANSPAEALSRLETLCSMAGLGLPLAAIRQQLASSVELLVQQARLNDGTRRITQIAELAGIGKDGNVRLRPIFEFAQRGTHPNGTIHGEHRATGYLPSFLYDMTVQGVIAPGEPWL
ncbi:MAG TPA: ATPase, T2SS/T4P/T4SS family [Polyangiales bacterium]|nr:ATPase, T2SS/T4P/T4SS family [Polyangiales bacterium]